MNIVGMVNEILWGKNVLVVLLVGAGIFFSLKTKFVQIRFIGDMIDLLREKNEGSDRGISSFQAFCISTASRVGAGNLIGVVAAISVGGPGALFWMWLVAILGASSAFAETILAIRYREKTRDGRFVGGPAFFLSKGVKKRWLGVLFVIFGIICWMGVMQVVANSVTESFNVAFGADERLISIGLVVVTAMVIFGKGDRITGVLSTIVPVMSVLYLGMAGVIILKNISLIPGLFEDILTQAFGIREAVGGSLGGMIMIGVKRGLFSNEAGSGSAPCVAASADVDHPVKQALLQSLGVFVDTLLICTATAFIMLLADVDKNLTGMRFLQESFRYHVGDWGIIFIAVILFLFAFSTVLGVLVYAKNNILFITEDERVVAGFKGIVLIMLFIGGVQQNLFVWSLADFGMGLMTVINLIGLFFLAGEVEESLKDYEEIRSGKRSEIKL